MTTGLVTYLALERGDPSRAIGKFRSSAAVAREVEAFRNEIGRLKAPEDLYRNRRLMRVVLSAYGLDSEINALGRIKAVLNSDIADPGALANRLKDRRYREIAGDLRIARTGLATLQKPDMIARLTDRYVAAEYEKSLGQQNPALREARYFAQNVGKARSIYEILGDPVLRKVLTETLGLPPQIALQPIESQAEAIRRRLDIAQFKPAADGGAATRARADLASDVAALESARDSAQAGLNATAEIARRLRGAISAYDGLAARQDPAGINAALLPIQEAAIPDLLRKTGLAAAAEAAIGRLADGWNQLDRLRAQAADPAQATHLPALKSEFAAMTARLHAEIGTGAAFRLDGAAASLLDGSISAPVTTVLDAAGTSVTLRSQDLNPFLAAIDTAAAAFAGVTDAQDGSHLAATRDALRLAGPMLGAARDSIAADRTALTAALARGADAYVVPLDSEALQRAHGSLIDGDARASAIAADLATLRAIAAESAARETDADRGSLVAEAATLIDNIAARLAGPVAGLDDPLGATDRLVALPGGRSLTLRGQALGAALDPTLATSSVADAARAAALVAAIDGTLLPQLAATRERMAIDRAVFTRAAFELDPRGRIDSSVRSINAELGGLIARARAGGTNLLGDGQTGLRVQFRSQVGALGIESHPTLRAALALDLAAALARLPGAVFGPDGARAALETAATRAEEAAAALRLGRGRADVALLDRRKRFAQTPASPQSDAAEAPSEFTRRFVQRYLAAQDGKAASAMGSGAMPTGPNAALIGLLA
jgi:hypothetical protein